MLTRKSALAAFGAVLVLVMATSVQGGATTNPMTYVTFSAPVALPGVTLEPGTYIFEVPISTMALNIVTVRDSVTSRAYFMGFTQAIERPAGVFHSVMLGESPAGVPPPIIAWYPRSETMGHKFVYR